MLTIAQLQTLKAHIDASGDLNTFPNNSDGNFSIAALLNVNASPDYFVWKSSVTIDSIMQNGFDWTLVDNATAQKWRIWEAMTKLGTIAPIKANQRAGILAAWPGATAAIEAHRLAIFGHCQRLASRVEKLLASGSGSTTDKDGVGPATMGFEGPISYSEVEQARNS